MQKVLDIQPYFSKNVDPYSTITWTKRNVEVKNNKGEQIFFQANVEAPDFWSDQAVLVASSKYFHGKVGTPERETSVKQVIDRVVAFIVSQALEQHYILDNETLAIFKDELTWLLINQFAAFNSPVFFNCGVPSKSRDGYHWDISEASIRPVGDKNAPQVSACFILGVDDNMNSIFDLAKIESILFKKGSGSGSNLSTIRSSKESITGGGMPSGPISFLRVYDAVAGVVRSGGVLRRAAKINVLNDDHPDILEFITCKSKEEEKARILISGGMPSDYNGEVYSTICFQNENLSVKVSDDFMRSAISDEAWQTKFVTDRNTNGPTYKAKELLMKMAESAWQCGDPGIMFNEAIQKGNTCKSSFSINSSNPCCEFIFGDNTSCNLSSLNLIKFLKEDTTFNTESFEAATRLMIISQDILVDSASYPTEKIALNSHNFRPLGLGYANLGSLILAAGFPYDSNEARCLAASVTALMTFTAYKVSSELANCLGSFEEFEKNKGYMLGVIKDHRQKLFELRQDIKGKGILYANEKFHISYTIAEEAKNIANSYGPMPIFRNAQVTVIAPTGTIGFFLGCDTTGLEPELALVKYKLLAGGGSMKIVNNTVEKALKRLGYDNTDIQDIRAYITKNNTIEGCETLKSEHLSVFDCALAPENGTRSIHWRGHLNMLAAVVPFLSGSASKTINLPNDCTVEDIFNIYIEGWKLGLKALAVYRDGSKSSQPLNIKSDKKDIGIKVLSDIVDINKVTRRHLPETRQSITHKFEIAGHRGYLTVGLFEDGKPGELFITMAKEGSTIGGLMDTLGTLVSLALQYGVPVEVLIKKFSYTRFEPSGWTKNKDIPNALSLVDYIFRWLGNQFSVKAIEPEPSIVSQEINSQPVDMKKYAKEPREKVELPIKPLFEAPSRQFEPLTSGIGIKATDNPLCPECGSMTVRNGHCFKCANCGSSLGCS